MMGPFESQWDSAAGDGALTPVVFARPECEFDALMDAWFRERRDSIEFRLYLEEAERLLRQITGERAVPVRLRQRSRLLLRAIRAVQKPRTDDPDLDL